MSTSQDPNRIASEVGFQFVRQYYTVLNKDPSKLHCFYKKQSLFVHGTEAEVAEIKAGQTDIDQEIKNIGFQNCKVNVSQFDSQPSINDSVLISVVGELSNQGGPSRRFTQTFFLASEDTERYYVLNDIFRFLKDSASASQDSQATNPPQPEISTPEPPKVSEAPKAAPPPVTPPPAPAPPETPKPKMVPVSPPAAASAPTPKPAPLAAPVQPPKPSGPATWASRAATSTPNQWGSNASALKGTVEAIPEFKQEKSERFERRERGERSERGERQPRERNQPPSDTEKDSSAYIKGVSKENEVELTEALSKFGTVIGITFLDTSSSAFVDFDSPLSLAASVNNGPIQLPSGKTIVAERRKPRRLINPSERRGKGEYSNERRAEKPRRRDDRDNRPRRDHTPSSESKRASNAPKN